MRYIVRKKSITASLLRFAATLNKEQIIVFLFDLFILFSVGIYMPSSRDNTEQSPGSQVWCLGPFLGFQLRLRSCVYYRKPSPQPKYQITGVNYAHNLLKLFSP